MLECLHTLLVSLLLSAAAGGGVDPSVSAGDEPADPETGFDAGEPATHLLSPRGPAQLGLKPGIQPSDDDGPVALAVLPLCSDPVISLPRRLLPLDTPRATAGWPTAGRSP